MTLILDATLYLATTHFPSLPSRRLFGALSTFKLHAPLGMSKSSELVEEIREASGGDFPKLLCTNGHPVARCPLWCNIARCTSGSSHHGKLRHTTVAAEASTHLVVPR